MAQKKIVFHILWKKKKLGVKFTLLSLIVIICLLQGIKIQVENELDIKDYEYAYILFQINRLIRENAILHEEILYYESLSIITKEAKEKGFIYGKYIFL